MQKQSAVMVIVLALLVSCASEPTLEETSTPVSPARVLPAQPVVSLSLEQLADYWLIGDSLSASDKPRYKKTIDYGCVRVGFGIDSEGRMFDVRVLKSNPQARYSDQAIKRINELEPEATEMNSVKQPVRSEIILTFANADGALSLVEYDAITKLCK